MTSILFVHQSAELYGSDKTLLIFLSRLDRTKFFPVVVLPFDGPLKPELEKEGVKVVIAPVLKLYRNIFTPKNILQFFKDIKKSFAVLKSLHRQHRFEIVYSNTLAVLLGMLFARRHRIRHIWHVHEIIVHPKIIAKLFPMLLNKFSDVVICNSAATKKNLTDRIPALEKKCVIIHNGVDPDEEQYQAANLKEAYGFSAVDVIVTLVGRISRLKGHKWLLSTYISHFKGSNVKLLFVGSPVPGQEYHLEEIEEMISENNLEKEVKVIPFTKGLSPVWAVTDIAVVPSTEAESFGLVALEGMLAKKPVVASAHGGVMEIIINNETGFLVAPENEHELAEAIQKLANDAGLRSTMGNRGYQRAVTHFSTENYVSKISGVLAGNV